MIQDSVYQETYPKLFALAYRMTGSVGDAEDAVQDAWIRLLNQPRGTVESPAYWLYRTVSNLAIDALRAAKRTATGYHGPWLPEPLAVDTYFRGPETEAILREDLSMALLLMLERLTPVQRAVWVLRTTLELSFAEIGAIVDRSEENCRQLFRRAKTRMTDRHNKQLVPASSQIVDAFLQAVQSGDPTAVSHLVMADVTWIGDGGGIKHATARPVLGADKVSRGLTSLVTKFAGTWHLETALINGHAGLLVREGDDLDSVYMFLTTDSRITHVLSVRNPHKLTGFQPRRDDTPSR